MYWYRTASGITHGRAPLDEDAIRAIEEQHPDIEFDWPAILALSEVMTPEDEAPPKPQSREREPRPGRRAKREPDGARQPQRDARRDDSRAQDDRPPVAVDAPIEPTPDPDPEDTTEVAVARNDAPRSTGLVDQLAGREIAARLRGRYAEITMRIRGADDATRESLMQLAEALDPDRWDTPEAVLHGVSHADALFEQLRVALQSSRE